MNDLILLIIALSFASIIGAGTLFYILSALKRKRAGKDLDTITLKVITERVRAVGKLVGLEVHAKEIATATTGLSWMPPILLSQAKVAMIFQFEKQYAIELGALDDSNVTQLTPNHYKITLPPIVGSLRLMDVEPYDIQQGRMLGLIDVINMNAARQSELMKTAQEQASDLFEKHDERYILQAKDAIERQLNAIAKLFDITLDLEWSKTQTTIQPRLELDDTLKTAPAPKPQVAAVG